MRGYIDFLFFIMNPHKLFIYLIIKPIVIKVVFLTENSFNRYPTATETSELLQLYC